VTRREMAKVVALYVATIAGATTIWIALFHTPFLSGSVFFYRGLVLLALTTLVAALVLVALWRTSFRGLIGVRDILLMVSLLLSINVVFFTHLPVTADRSISVFMLAFMERADGPLTADEISDGVVQHVVAGQAIDKRLDEQLVTGTLVQEGDGYVISEEGRWLVGFYEFVARLFNIDPANLRP
jgi:hypothetical protein